MKSSEVLYKNPDDKKIQEWLKVNRLQLPLPSTTSVSNNNVTKDSEKSNTEQKKTFSLKEPVEQVRDLLAVHSYTMG